MKQEIWVIKTDVSVHLAPAHCQGYIINDKERSKLASSQTAFMINVVTLKNGARCTETPVFITHISCYNELIPKYETEPNWTRYE